VVKEASKTDPAQPTLFESLLRHVSLSSGMYRTTFRGRFDNLNPVVNAVLAKHFSRDEPIRIEDWASSDCLTSAEWASGLLDEFPAATFKASDVMLFLIEVRLPGGEIFVVEPGGEPLQYIRPPFVIRLNPPEPRVLLVNSIEGSRARSRWSKLRKAWNPPDAWMHDFGNEPWNSRDFSCYRISLVHPEAEELRRLNSRFQLRQHSVFAANEYLSNVIRTMNILNLAYFSRARLVEGIRAVAASLAPGGVWVVGRTYEEHPPRHNASILVKEANRFRLIERYGKGSEVEDLALAESLF
jgi:hypothetical protein